MEFEIVFDREEDGRWIAEIESLPGVLAYGATRNDAQSKVEALDLRVVADRIEIDRSIPEQVRFALA
jgi:predicted RNase H-like HicB family nuclease